MKDGRNIEKHIETIDNRITNLERGIASTVFLTSPNGTIYELVVSDSGQLSVVGYQGVACSSISIDKTTASMYQEDTLQLTATVLPIDCTLPVIWSASNSNCVVNNGLVTAVSVGDCVITAKCGDKTATCNITVNEKVNVDVDVDVNEPGLVAYYMASAHGDDDTAWQDLCGNNHATITGTGILWEDDMMKITDTNTIVTFPFAPMADPANNFRIEVEYSNNNITEYTPCTLLSCLEEVSWIGGLTFAANSGSTNEKVSCRLAGVTHDIPRDTVNAESFKLKLEYKNKRSYIYVNDELVKESGGNDKASDVNLFIGTGKVNVKYLKYYTNI
jgi:hypothetical protein